MLKLISKSGVKQKVCTGGYRGCKGGGGGGEVTHLKEMEAEVADWWSCFPLKQSFPLCLLLQSQPPNTGHEAAFYKHITINSGEKSRRVDV